MPASLLAQQARAEELTQAFEIIFKPVPQRERPARVANALKLIREGELNPAGVWVVRGTKGLRGALVCMLVPGASALVWPPQALVEPEQEIEDTLLRAALAWVRKQGTKLAQSLLSAHEIGLAAPLQRNGFAHITRLSYLRHQLGFPVELLAPEQALDFVDYRTCDRTLFHEILLASYQGTQDCPEVNGVRTLAEIIAGHKAQGIHDPGRWWLALRNRQAVGVLILTELPEWNGWDISYLGVVPEARRSGIGKELTRKALKQAQAAGASQLTLSVDDRNRAAMDLYTGLGFEAFDQREVYLAIW